MTYPPSPGPEGYGQGTGGYGQSGPENQLSGVESYWAANPGPEVPPLDPPVVPYRPPVYPPPATGYGYGSPYGYLGQYQQAPATDGFAIAALVVSCVGVLSLCAYGLGGVLGIVGAIFGHVARRRIRATGAGGEGLALAGIIVGWLSAFLAVVGVIVLVVVIVMSETGRTY